MKGRTVYVTMSSWRKGLDMQRQWIVVKWAKYVEFARIQSLEMTIYSDCEVSAGRRVLASRRQLTHLEIMIVSSLIFI